MGDRWTRIVIVALLVVLGVYIGQPYVDRMLYSASTPRAIEPRGSLSEIERTTDRSVRAGLAVRGAGGGTRRHVRALPGRG